MPNLEPGLLELPASEDRRAALAVRAGWPLISSNLSDKPKVAVAVRESVKQIEGTTDEVRCVKPTPGLLRLNSHLLMLT